MDKLFKIKIKAAPENLERIASFIEKNLLKLNIKKDILEEVLISIDEATSNIVQHSYRHIKQGYIRLVLTVKKDRILVSIFDKGRIFEPDKVPSPDFSKNLNERALGGLGVFLMKKFMDEVTFLFKNSSDKKENELKMVKYLK